MICLMGIPVGTLTPMTTGVSTQINKYIIPLGMGVGIPVMDQVIHNLGVISSINY